MIERTEIVEEVLASLRTVLSSKTASKYAHIIEQDVREELHRRSESGDSHFKCIHCNRLVQRATYDRHHCPRLDALRASLNSGDATK